VAITLVAKSEVVHKVLHLLRAKLETLLKNSEIWIRTLHNALVDNALGKGRGHLGDFEELGESGAVGVEVGERVEGVGVVVGKAEIGFPGLELGQGPIEGGSEVF